MSTKKMFVTTYHSKVNTLLQLERNLARFILARFIHKLHDCCIILPLASFSVRLLISQRSYVLQAKFHAEQQTQIREWGLQVCRSV